MGGWHPDFGRFGGWVDPYCIHTRWTGAGGFRRDRRGRDARGARQQTDRVGFGCGGADYVVDGWIEWP